LDPASVGTSQGVSLSISSADRKFQGKGRGKWRGSHFNLYTNLFGGGRKKNDTVGWSDQKKKLKGDVIFAHWGGGKNIIINPEQLCLARFLKGRYLKAVILAPEKRIPKAKEVGMRCRPNTRSYVLERGLQGKNLVKMEKEGTDREMFFLKIGFGAGEKLWKGKE